MNKKYLERLFKPVEEEKPVAIKNKEKEVVTCVKEFVRDENGHLTLKIIDFNKTIIKGDEDNV